jgi:hypothetical protein
VLPRLHAPQLKNWCPFAARRADASLALEWPALWPALTLSPEQCWFAGVRLLRQARSFRTH